MNILPFAFGLFAASYMQNSKFRSQVDSGLKFVLNKGVDTLNNIGGVPDVATTKPDEPVRWEDE